MEIAVLGLGLMGLAIAKRLQATGHHVRGWNRSADKTNKARLAGIDASSALDHIADTSTLVLTLSDAGAIHETLAGIGSFTDRLIIQMGTIAPGESRDIASMVEGGGGRYLEAPVLGSIPEAGSGTLIIMAGGAAADFEAALPVLDSLGSKPKLIGEVGQGAALKLAMNQLIAGLTTSFCASLGLVRAEDIDTDLFMTMLRESALYAPTFDKKLEKMINREYGQANFPLKHLHKDIRLFENAGEDRKLETGVIAALCALVEAGIAAGYGDDDYSSLYEAVNPATDSESGSSSG